MIFLLVKNDIKDFYEIFYIVFFKNKLFVEQKFIFEKLCKMLEKYYIKLYNKNMIKNENYELKFWCYIFITRNI